MRQLLGRGEHVAATTRSADRLLAALDGVDIARLAALTVDLRDETEVADAVRTATSRFGDLDVVVNNAGYGFLGAVEETSDAEARAMFDVQVFGAWNVLRATLPILRARRNGQVISISSILGLTTVAGWGLYSAGKYALEGISETLAAEVAEHGIKVSIVEPGYFRTDFLTTDALGLPAQAAEGYEPIREMTRQHLALQGGQLGNPVEGAKAIIRLAVSGTGPLRQQLGSDSYGFAVAKVAALQEDIVAGRELAHTTDHVV